MDNPEEFRLFELARFDREVLRPRAALFAEPISNWAHQRYDLAELLEGYLWLELGVDLDIFPLRDRARIISHWKERWCSSTWGGLCGA